MGLLRSSSSRAFLAFLRNPPIALMQDVDYKFYDASSLSSYFSREDPPALAATSSVERILIKTCLNPLRSQF
jgi:hypothetical protein